MTTTGRAQPFLKWAGGKRQLLPRILPLVPAKVRTYYEPFLGGGAVFFALANEGRFERARLSDANIELIRAYQAVRADVEGVLAVLAQYENTKEHYLDVRSIAPSTLSDVECAARMIFLNKRGFNGIYRVNSKGGFNVPFGDSPSLPPTFVEPDVLRSASAALNLPGVTIEARDFRDIGTPTPGDFVYFDPPYVPISKTANFTGYQAGGFGHAEQSRLAEMFRGMGARGVDALLSNADCDVTRELYAGLSVHAADARRSINSVGSKRGAVRELLVVATALRQGAT